MSSVSGDEVRRMSLFEVAEEVKRGQGFLDTRTASPGSTAYAGPQKERHTSSDRHQGQPQRFCVTMPCIPLNLEVSLPTL